MNKHTCPEAELSTSPQGRRTTWWVIKHELAGIRASQHVGGRCRIHSSTNCTSSIKKSPQTAVRTNRSRITQHDNSIWTMTLIILFRILWAFRVQLNASMIFYYWMLLQLLNTPSLFLTCFSEYSEDVFWPITVFSVTRDYNSYPKKFWLRSHFKPNSSVPVSALLTVNIDIPMWLVSNWNVTFLRERQQLIRSYSWYSNREHAWLGFDDSEWSNDWVTQTCYSDTIRWWIPVAPLLLSPPLLFHFFPLDLSWSCSFPAHRKDRSQKAQIKKDTVAAGVVGRTGSCTSRSI